MGRHPGALLLAALLLASLALGVEPARVDLVVEPEQGTVGDRFDVRLDLDLPADARFEPQTLGPTLGSLPVVSGAWEGPREAEGRRLWRWSGQVASYRTGEFTVPPVRLVVEDAAGGRHEVETPERRLRVVSVLDAAPEGAAPQELADIKPPASVPPDFRWIVAAGGASLALLLAALVLWWLHRRYAARLAAVPFDDSPFRRTPPHVWVYAELQRLLDQRLAESGEVDRFFSELARLVKFYLGGRYRVALMERTTDEVPADLEQAGAPEGALAEIAALLALCDRVKFAHHLPDPSACREAIEHAYRIVDATKPREEPVALERGAA
jgi:hypothetical protein